MPALNHFDYFSDIEETFVRRRGKHLLIGPLDWALIESWQEREIPLRVVLRAINEVFDSIEQRAENPVNVRSLKYCSPTVERLFAEWSSAHVGSSDTEQESSSDIPADLSHLDQHLNNCIARLDGEMERLPQVLYEGAQDILKRLVEISSKQEREGVEDELEDFDGAIDKAVIKNKVVLATAEIEREIRLELEKHGLPAASVDEAFERLLCREIRRVYKIPRFGLYKL